MSRSLMISSYARFWLCLSASASMIWEPSFLISPCCATFWALSWACRFLALSIWSFSWSQVRSTCEWKKLSFLNLSSFSLISSLSCSIWWCMILNFRFISAISSCDSTKFLEYKFLSVRTASYSSFCCLSLPLTSASFFFNSEILLSLFLSSSKASMYLLLACEQSMPYFSLALSSSTTFLTASCRSCFTRSTSFSKAWLRVSCCFTRSVCFFVRSSVRTTPRCRPSRSRWIS
mmetsp:Transcript_24217/g.55289  ORF Transcript_24217/g.55289 Transcript_24217/m.55289 type:complete len:233 (-) Transcript_24217:342-1040(-)